MFSRFNLLRYMNYTDILIYYFFSQLYSMQDSLLVTASIFFAISGFMIIFFSYYQIYLFQRINTQKQQIIFLISKLSET